MVPLAAVMTLKNDAGPYRVVRLQSLSFGRAPGVILRAATHRSVVAHEMAEMAGKTLPKGCVRVDRFSLISNNRLANTGTYVFGLAVLFVFLLLAAQYESVVLPLA